MIANYALNYGAIALWQYSNSTAGTEALNATSDVSLAAHGNVLITVSRSKQLLDSIGKISKMILLAAFLIAALGTSLFLYKSAMTPKNSTSLIQKIN